MGLINFYEELKTSVGVLNNVVLYRGQLESIIEFDEQTDEPLDTTLTRFLKKNYQYIISNENKCSDYISHICAYTIEAMREISQNLRTRIIKEYDYIPIYKVKEFDSVSTDWLAKQQGRNIIEKVLCSPNIKAPIRKFSVDTLENRLFKEFIENIYNMLLKRNQVQILKDQVCAEVCDLIEDFIDDEVYSEISEWRDTPPNNSLLNDKNYSKIYKAYCDLLEIDKIIALDVTNEQQNRLRFFAVNVVSILQEEYGLRLCERPFGIDYITFKLSSSDKWQGICGSSKFEFFMQDDVFILVCNGNELNVTDKMIGTSASEALKKARKLVEKYADEFKLRKCYTSKRENYKDQHIFIDIFSVQPNINGRTLPFLNICQYWKELHSFIDLTDAKALYINDSIDTYSICNAYTNINMLSRFAYNIKHYLEAHQCNAYNNIVFVYPDLLSDNEMKPIKRVLKLYFGKIKLMPASVAGVWSKVSREPDNFKSGDTINVVGYFSQYVYVTMIRLIESHDEKVKQCGGFIIERFPTIKQKVSCDDNLSEILGLNKDMKTFEKYSFYDEEYFSYKPNTNESVNKELLLRAENKYANIAQRFTRKFYVNGQIPQTVFAQGMYECAELTNIDIGKLWKEHLPVLVIEDGIVLNGRYNKFELVGLDGDIDIKESFTLPKGKEEFCFTLKQGSGAEQITQYISLKSDILPLKEDTMFNLILSYNFDDDDVYKLLFIGKNDSSLKIKAIFTDKPQVITGFPKGIESIIFVKNLEGFDDYNMKELCCDWLKAMIGYINNNSKITDETNGDYWSYDNAENYIIVSLDIGKCEKVFNQNGELTGKKIYINDDYNLFISKKLFDKVKYAGIYLAKVQSNRYENGLNLVYVTSFKPSWLCLLNTDNLDEEIENNLEKLLVANNYLDKLAVAYLIKDAALVYQENLLNKIIDFSLSDKPGYIGILSSAVQLNTSLIYKINFERAKKLCQLIYDKVNKYINDCSKDPSTKTINKLCRALELLLNLIRWREIDETFLYPTDEVAIKFAKQVMQITELNIADKLNLKSFVKADIPPAFKDDTPVICYLLYNYLTGKDESVVIEVTVMEEE